MRSLKVKLDYVYSSDRPYDKRGLALPLKVLNADGGLIAEEAISKQLPATFKIPQEFDPVFVRLTWPSGSSQTKRVDFGRKSTRTETFTDQSIGHNEWSAWAVPRLNRKSDLAKSGVVPALKIDPYQDAWLRLWKFGNGKWAEAPVKSVEQKRNDAVRQVDFDLPANPWLVQVGGSNVPWRFVSLPGGGRCRVLLTPNSSSDPRADPLKIIVTGFRPDAEMLLEFLSRDAMRAANSMAEFRPMAVQLLADKFEDPIAAAASAYFLLRTGSWEKIPSSWFDTLNNNFQWIPDAAIIRCVVMIREGLKKKGDLALARRLLVECGRRGLPIFAEGLALMQEAASVLRRPGDPKKQDKVFDMIQHLAASTAWAGAAFSFYGAEPEAPSPAKRLGYPSDKPEVAGTLESLASTKSAVERTDISRRASTRKRKSSAKSAGRPRSPGTLLFLGDIGKG